MTVRSLVAAAVAIMPKSVVADPSSNLSPPPGASLDNGAFLGIPVTGVLDHIKLVSPMALVKTRSYGLRGPLRSTQRVYGISMETP